MKTCCFVFFLFFLVLHLIVFFSFSICCCHLQREKKNLQDLNGVYVFNVPERECIDRPTARLIKEFDLIEGMGAGLPFYSFKGVNYFFNAQLHYSFSK